MAALISVTMSSTATYPELLNRALKCLWFRVYVDPAAVAYEAYTDTTAIILEKSTTRTVLYCFRTN